MGRRKTKIASKVVVAYLVQGWRGDDQQVGPSQMGRSNKEPPDATTWKPCNTLELWNPNNYINLLCSLTLNIVSLLIIYLHMYIIYVCSMYVYPACYLVCTSSNKLAQCFFLALPSLCLKLCLKLCAKLLHPVAASPIAQTEGGNGQERRKQDQRTGHQQQR